MPDINKFLSEMKSSSTAEVSTQWAKAEELYNKKLWHQLTKLLSSLVKEASLQDKLITIYQEFIVDFESRIDPLSLVLIAQIIMERYVLMLISNFQMEVNSLLHFAGLLMLLRPSHLSRKSRRRPR